MRRKFFPALLISFSLLLVLGYFATPLLVEYKIKALLGKLQEISGISTRFNQFHYSFFSEVEISDLEIETARGFTAIFDRVRMNFDPLSFLSSPLVVREIDIAGGLIDVNQQKGRAAKPENSKEEITKIFPTINSRILRRFPRLEKISLSSLTVVFQSAHNYPFVLSDGEFFGTNISLERGRVRLDGSGSFRIPDGENLIRMSFIFDIPGIDTEVNALFDRSLVFNFGGYTTVISGASFKSNEGVRFLNPVIAGRFPLNGLNEIKAEEIFITSLELKELLRSGEFPATKDFEVEILKPSILLSSSETEAATGGTKPKFPIGDLLTTLTRILERFYDSLPFRKLSIKDGLIASPKEENNNLFSLYLDLEKSLPEKRLSFILRFETPESRAELNSVKGIYFRESGDYQIDLKIDSLTLHRFKDFLTREVIVDSHLRMRNSELTLLYSRADGAGEITGELFFSGLNLNLPYVTLEPIRDLSIGIGGSLTFDERKKELKIPEGRLYINEIMFNFGLTVQKFGDKPVVDLALTLPRTNCDELVKSIPKEIIRTLEGIKVSGSFAFDLSLWFDSADLSTLKFSFKPDIQDFHVLDMGKNLHFELIKENFVHRIEAAGGKVIYREVGPGSPDWVPLDRVAECLPLAVTTTEDTNFFKHRGFSLFAIRDSLITNIEKWGFYRGASTISQQLVKNLFLSREKTLSRKLQEIFITWQLERFISKERILELYLNVIEWGNDIYGIKEAARHYFRKEPDELNLNECAFLVAILPNPMSGEKEFAKGELSHSWRDKIRRILKLMYERGKITEDQFLGSQPYSVNFLKGEAEENADPELLSEEMAEDEE